ncbi:DUF1460 domain-containing protein [Bacteroidales bacterium OttesenSCG-928-A17]|nr:DUF1460 domain-containing protein [Bacteroidales bacterium OttesenSCG-928-A17]
MKWNKLWFIFLIFPLSLQAQVSSDWVKDTEILNRYLSSVSKMPVDSAIFQSALFFLNSPYESGILEGEEEETLIVDLRSFDCVTFVESCLALSRCLQYSSPDMDYFERELRAIRYRNGQIDGYTSRLHYTSDWIYDNAVMGIIEDITHALGGHRVHQNTSFMTENYTKYPVLKEDPSLVGTMREIEQRINSRNYFYVPKSEIALRQSEIKNGDIVCFTTSVPGLDISHLGIAYHYKNQLTFIHASSRAGKVIINPESLEDYCKKIKSTTGIMVLRALHFNPLSE